MNLDETLRGIIDDVATRVASDVFDVGSVDSMRPRRMAFMLAGERMAGGLCESSLSIAITASLQRQLKDINRCSP